MLLTIIYIILGILILGLLFFKYTKVMIFWTLLSGLVFIAWKLELFSFILKKVIGI